MYDIWNLIFSIDKFHIRQNITPMDQMNAKLKLWIFHRSNRGALRLFIGTKSAIFCFRNSEVPWKLKTKKTGTMNNTLSSRAYKNTFFTFCDDK
jgi:hypothetical protein